MLYYAINFKEEIIINFLNKEIVDFIIRGDVAVLILYRFLYTSLKLPLYLILILHRISSMRNQNTE